MNHIESHSELIPINGKEHRYYIAKKKESCESCVSFSDRTIFLQRTVGNHAVERIVRSVLARLSGEQSTRQNELRLQPKTNSNSFSKIDPDKEHHIQSLHHFSHDMGIIQRYGQSRSCKDDEHLKPFIWPGHHNAKQIVKRGIEETDGRPLTTDTEQQLKTFFGKKSVEPGNLAKIHVNFQRIQQALEQDYLYHCSRSGESSEGLPCKGQNAETERTGRRDITLCFDRVHGWSIPAAGWLITHENFHRLNVWGHSWEAGNIEKCVFNGGALSAADLELNNADSYACFAALLWALKP